MSRLPETRRWPPLGRTQEIRKAARWIVGVMVLWVLGCGGPSAVEKYGLEPVPRPEIAAFESAVREQLGEAVTALEARLDDPASDARGLSEEYGELGRKYQVYELYEAAEQSFRNALRIAPEDRRWLHHLAVVLQTTGQLDEAAERFGQVLGLEPDDLPARVRLGQTLFDAGQPEEARTALERALEIDPRCALAHYFLGRLELSGGRPELAAERFERALEIQPRANRLHYHLAQAYQRLGDEPRARSHGRQVGNDEVWLEDPLIQGLEDLQAGAAAFIRRAAAAQIDGYYEVALEQYRKAVAADPDNPEARQGVGGMLAQLGDLEAAVEQLEKARQLDPGNARVHFNLGGLKGTLGDLDTAIEHYEAALRINPRYDDALLAYGRMLAQHGRLAEATERFERMLELDPWQIEARLALADVQAQQGRSALAEGQLREALDLDLGAADRSRIWTRLGSLALARGDAPAARRALDEAIAADPSQADPHFALANLLGASGRFDDAATSYGRAAQLRPTEPTIRLGEATALVLAERWSEARARLEAALEAIPGHHGLMLSLARILATSPEAAVRSGPRAVALAEGVHRQLPTLDSAEVLAMALAEVGRFDEAVGWQEQIVRELQRLGRPDLLAPAQQRLDSYRGRRPIRGS